MKTLLITALLCAATGAMAQKTDFSGSYKVNEEKVNWGPAPKFILPRYIKVVQLKDRIIISKTTLNQQLEEQVPIIDTISFDRNVFVKANRNGGTTASSLTWTNDTSFVIVRKSLNSAGELTGTTTEIWNLEDGGKTLYINRDIEGRMTFNTKAYFDRQK